MKLSIIIPAQNEAAMLPQTLRAIDSARAGTDSEVIVVENTAPASAARNQGAASATGDWLVFVDADTTPTTGLFQAMATAIRTERYDAGSCLLQHERGDNFGITLWNLIAQRRKRLTGAFLFIRNSTFHDVGGFNPETHRGEEWELTQRLSPSRIVILSNVLFLRERSSRGVLPDVQAQS